MMPRSQKIGAFRKELESLEQVDRVTVLDIEGDKVCSIELSCKKAGEISVRALQVGDAKALLKFYKQGLSDKSQALFYPYPLFRSPFDTEYELSSRITSWQKEDDWIFLNMFQGNEIVGVVFLKRLRTDKPTSGVAVRDECQGMGLGHLLQVIIVEQARLMGVKRFYVKLEADNMASRMIHQKCGFEEIGTVPYKGLRDGLAVEINVLEMIIVLA